MKSNITDISTALMNRSITKDLIKMTSDITDKSFTPKFLRIALIPLIIGINSCEKSKGNSSISNNGNGKLEAKSIDTAVLAVPKQGMKQAPLTGMWVESVLKLDTLEFASEYDGQFPHFALKRKAQIIDGNAVPGWHSGLYSYKLGENSISTQWSLSSNSEFSRFYFNMDQSGNEFKIENFFADSTEMSDTLTFQRIKNPNI